MRAVPVFAGFTMEFTLQLRKKHGKTSVRAFRHKHTMRIHSHNNKKYINYMNYIKYVSQQMILTKYNIWLIFIIRIYPSFFFFLLAQQTSVGQSLLILEVSISQTTTHHSR